MTINELSITLSDAYSLENLNKISVSLINLYKNQQYSILQKISELINDFTAIEISPEGKGFSKLIMLYHPDKLAYYQNEIKRRVENDDFDGLLELSHILKLIHVEEIATALNSFEDIDYSPLYDWEMETEGFTIINDSGKVKKHTTQRADYDAKTMDISDNRITDISPLFGLTQLEELNISDNEIQNIDAMSNLLKLKTANLANNQIEDISPLFELEMLMYIDLRWNKVDEEQIKQLTGLGIEVDY